jgi:hypothetical protein
MQGQAAVDEMKEMKTEKERKVWEDHQNEKQHESAGHLFEPGA